MDGAIISTNTLGNIHVNGGLGAVTIDNETGIPVVVQNVSAGTNSLYSTVSSKVDIIDTNQPAATQHTPLRLPARSRHFHLPRARRARPRQTSLAGTAARVHVRDDSELFSRERPPLSVAAPGQSHP